MTLESRPTRRFLVAGSATAIVAGALTHHAPAIATQVDRDLLDLLRIQEQVQIAHYTALLKAFDEPAFTAAGLPENARSTISSILLAEEAHLEVLSRPGLDPTEEPVAPVLDDLRTAIEEAAELKNLAVASYALVIAELDRPRLLPDLVGIHSVEARHAAWLAILLGANPFPNTIDAPLELDDAVAAPTALGAASPVTDASTVQQEIAPIIAAIGQDLSVPPQSVQVISVDHRDWPDSSLGCPQPDMLYAQVVTPGYLIVVEVAGDQVEYHTDERGSVVRCPKP